MQTGSHTEFLTDPLKIGAVVTISVRRVRLAMSSACPDQQEYIAAFHALNVAAR